LPPTSGASGPVNPGFPSGRGGGGNEQKGRGSDSSEGKASGSECKEWFIYFTHTLLATSHVLMFM
jgi:hypothetical protein